MKTISLLTALLHLQALGVYALNCTTSNPLEVDGPSGADIASGIQLGDNGPIDNICKNKLEDTEAGPIIYNAGSLVFSLSRTAGVLPAAADCKSALTSIISQCIVTENVWGGSVEAQGLLIEISEGGDDDEHRIEARGKKKSKSKSKKTKPKKTKSKKTKAAKTKAAKTKSKKTKATKTKATKTKATKTSSSKCQQTGKKGGKGKGKAKKGGKGKRAEPDGDSCPVEVDCAKGFDIAAKQLKKISTRDLTDMPDVLDANTTLVSPRDYHVGSMSGMVAHEIARRAEIEKRGTTSKKTGKACGLTWNADDYPTVDAKAKTVSNYVCPNQRPFLMRYRTHWTTTAGSILEIVATILGKDHSLGPKPTQSDKPKRTERQPSQKKRRVARRQREPQLRRQLKRLLKLALAHLRQK